MSLGDLVVHPGDVEWAGFLLSGNPVYGADPLNPTNPIFPLDGIEGLGLPAIRDASQTRTTDGVSMGSQITDARTITASGCEVYGIATLRNLRAAMKRRQDPVEFVYLGLGGPSDSKMLLRARPSVMTFPNGDKANTDGIWTVDLEWVADDPRIYSLTVQHATVGNTASSDNILNSGDEDAPWSFTVDGPCVKPRLRLAPDFGGHSFFYRGTVASGKTLSVNSRTRTATIAGASVLGSCEGNTSGELHDWWLLPIGVDNDVRFACDSGPSTVDFTWRNTWL